MRLRLASTIFGIALATPVYAVEIGDQVKEFANYGVVGALCIILGVVLFQKEKEKAKLVKSWDEERSTLNAARLVDYKDMAATLSGVRTGLAEWTAANVERNATVTALGHAISALGTTIQLHTAAIERQTLITEKAFESNRELRDALIANGIRP